MVACHGKVTAGLVYFQPLLVVNVAGVQVCVRKDFHTRTGGWYFHVTLDGLGDLLVLGVGKPDVWVVALVKVNAHQVVGSIKHKTHTVKVVILVRLHGGKEVAPCFLVTGAGRLSGGLDWELAPLLISHLSDEDVAP